MHSRPTTFRLGPRVFAGSGVQSVESSVNFVERTNVIDEMGDNELIRFVLDDEDSTEMEIELVQRLGDALGEIDLLAAALQKVQE